MLAFCIMIHCKESNAQKYVTPPKTNNNLTRSYNWWKLVNPTNVNYFATFTNVNPANYDTGFASYAKRTAISLVGWVNHQTDLGTAISNDSLVHLEPLVYLEQLLIKTSIGDAGLMHIRNLKYLRHFEIAISGSPDAGITNEGGAAILGTLTNLEILRLYFCSNITDAGIERLTGLTKLRELGLNGCGISDKCLSYLRSFPKLEILSIAATGITDYGVETLIGLLPSLPSLKKIIISNSKITPRGRESLIAARKGLSVIY